MRPIKKRKNEPVELTDFKKTLQGAVEYKDTYYALSNDENTFPKLQLTLASEQGFICAYCEQRIPFEEQEKVINSVLKGKMKIEHYKPQSVYDGKKKTPDLRIEYTNFLAVCVGREVDAKETHCDTPPQGKGDNELIYLENPCLWEKNRFNPRLRYSKKCKIYSDDENIYEELGRKETEKGNGILNLNEQNLHQKRFRVWRGVKRRIDKEVGTPDWQKDVSKTKKIVRKYIQIYKAKKTIGSHFVYRPFGSCVLYQLEKWLSRN